MARLHEALQCCMWSNMRKVNVQAAAVEIMKPISLESKNEESKHQDPPAAEDKNLAENQIKSSNNDQAEPNPDLTAQQLMKAKFFEDDLEKEDEETENMFALVEEIKNARQTNQNLDDDQRRANAEQIMNKLAKMMDLGDDGEGDISYGDEEI